MHAPAFAPFSVLKNSHAFLPTVKGLMALSEAYANISISGGTGHKAVLRRKEELADDRYYRWSKIQRHHLQHR
jgi:hypothetical protein